MADSSDVGSKRPLDRMLDRPSAGVSVKRPKSEASEGAGDTLVPVSGTVFALPEGVRIKTEAPDRGYEEKLPHGCAGAALGRLLRPKGMSAPRPGKENMREEPVDMTTNKGDSKRDRRPLTPDVIVLSDDSSSPKTNGQPNGTGDLEIAAEMLKNIGYGERTCLIRRLRNELRLEEAKLALLKKLRLGQLQREHAHVKIPPERQHVTGGPPPLVRGGQAMSVRPPTQPSVKPMGIPPLIRGTQLSRLFQRQQVPGVRVPPPLLMAPRLPLPNSGSLSCQRLLPPLPAIHAANNGKPGLVPFCQSMALSARLSGASIVGLAPGKLPGASGSNQFSLGSKALLGGSGTGIGGTGVTSAGGLSESPASRQAAAKLALRKQLEKTLLEIPPPKAPGPEINFLPSAANGEFIYLLGLEEAVLSLLTSHGRMSNMPSEPFSCIQCLADFTPRWARCRDGVILCEPCLAANLKRKLKAEHTDRLKAAFLKALQQEQEIEQQFKQQSVGAGLAKAESVIHHRPSLKQAQSQVPLAGRLSQAALRGISPYIPHSTVSSLLAGNAPLNMMYVQPSMSAQKASISPSLAERQREYLLDMIPSRPVSKPSTPNAWK
uniref:transcriptional repressor p66-beta-like isoform X2 n=1 Tax=Myxine glutinosa TaxID=7769 RepID=UPI00358E4C5D